MNNFIQKHLSNSFTTIIIHAVDARIYLGRTQEGLALQTWMNDFDNSVKNV